MIRRLVFLFPSWIHQELNLWSPEQGNTFCTAKKLFCLWGCLLEKKNTQQIEQQLSPRTHIPQSDYNQWAVFLYALWLLYLTDQSFGGWKGKLWVYKDKYVMKELIIFHEALNATKPAWWSFRDGLFKLPDWWADYRMIWNILLTRMIFHHFSQSG